MKNRNMNAMQDATGVSDRWFNRNLAFAFAGIAASIFLDLLTRENGRIFVASLLGLR